jgi:hypothetical protein
MALFVFQLQSLKGDKTLGDRTKANVQVQKISVKITIWKLQESMKHNKATKEGKETHHEKFELSCVVSCHFCADNRKPVRI